MVCNFHSPMTYKITMVTANSAKSLGWLGCQFLQLHDINNCYGNCELGQLANLFIFGNVDISGNEIKLSFTIASEGVRRIILGFLYQDQSCLYAMIA